MRFSVDISRLIRRVRRRGSVNTSVAFGAAALVVVFAGLAWIFPPPENQNVSGQEDPLPSQLRSESAKLHPVVIRKPTGPPRVLTGQTDAHGNPITVSCSTCHSTRKPNSKTKSTKDLNEFHGSMVFAHGNLSCLSCHNPDDYDTLKLADNTRIEYRDVMTLCAQCHGQQKREFDHGAHGGMTGFWDRSRGPKFKNNCIDCHNPHTPKFPKMQPDFKPKDRFLDKVDH